MKRNNGFTLLELIIVLFLTTLVLGISTVFFANTLPSNRLNATAREMAATIRYAKYLALTKGESQTLMIDLDSRNYTLGDQSYKHIPSDIHIEVVDPLSEKIVHGKYPITFYGSGGIEGGTIMLSTGKKLVRIELDPVVGSVIIK